MEGDWGEESEFEVSEGLGTPSQSGELAEICVWRVLRLTRGRKSVRTLGGWPMVERSDRSSEKGCGGLQVWREGGGLGGELGEKTA